MSAKRVVLLAREGAARSRSEDALKQAGVALAAVLDPVDVEVERIASTQPDVLFIVLDPVVEVAMDRFDALFNDPNIELFFDDADVASKRDGWEFSRWVRHLAAKLNGHQDVLPAAPAQIGTLVDEVQALSMKLAELPLPMHVHDAPSGKQEGGAVVIVGGVGGPDAVRQLLASLPASFPQPVVLRQKIAGGQYDRLVRQMQRATQLQVVLGNIGDALLHGVVYVLADGQDIAADDGQLKVAAAAGEPRFAALKASETALLLLSGADPALLDSAMTLRWSGAMVYGQSPENCFDPSTSQALLARGGEVRGLAAMSRQLLERWSS